MLAMGSPGERRLDRPPSDRYRTAVEPEAAPAGSMGRAVAAAALASAGWALATVLLGGVLALSAGLIVLAAAFGRVVGLATAWGGGPALSPRARVAVTLALIADGFILGQLGLWAYSRVEGGVLDPLAYLGETFGVLVPVQLVVAGLVGWRTAR